MPAVTTPSVEEQNEADQKMWSALKRYIIRERQRKKEGDNFDDTLSAINKLFCPMRISCY